MEEKTPNQKMNSTTTLTEDEDGDGDRDGHPSDFKVTFQACEDDNAAKQKILNMIDDLAQCCCLDVQESRTKTGAFVSISVKEKSVLVDGNGDEGGDADDEGGDRDVSLSSSSTVKLIDTSDSLENDAVETKNAVPVTTIIDFDDDAETDVDADIIPDDNSSGREDTLQTYDDGGGGGNNEKSSGNISNSNSTIIENAERDNEETFCSARSSMENISNVDSVSQDSGQEPIESSSKPSPARKTHDSDSHKNNEKRGTLSSDAEQTESSERLEKGDSGIEGQQDVEDSISMSSGNRSSKFGNTSSHDKPAKALKNSIGENDSSLQSSITPQGSDEDVFCSIVDMDHDNFLTCSSEGDERSELNSKDCTDNTVPENINADKSTGKSIENGKNDDEGDDGDDDFKIVERSVEHESFEDLLRANNSEVDSASKDSTTPQGKDVFHSFENKDIGFVRAIIQHQEPMSDTNSKGNEGAAEKSTMDAGEGQGESKSVHSRDARTSEGAAVSNGDLFHSCIDYGSDRVLMNVKDGQQLGLSNSNRDKDEEGRITHNEQVTIATNSGQSKDGNSDEEMAFKEESHQAKTKKKTEVGSTVPMIDVADEDKFRPINDKFVSPKSIEEAKGENSDAVREDEDSNYEMPSTNSSEESGDVFFSFQEHGTESGFADFHINGAVSPMIEESTSTTADLSRGLGNTGMRNKALDTNTPHPSISNTDLKPLQEDTCNLSKELSVTKNNLSISETNVMTTQEEINSRKGNSIDVEHEIDSLKQNASQHSAIVSALNGQVLAYQESINLYKQRVEELNHGAASLKGELDEKEKMIKLHDAAKKRLEKDCMSLSDLAQSQEERIKTLQSEVDECKTQLSSLQSLTKSSADEIIDLNKDVAYLTESVGVKNDHITSQNDELERLKEENASLVDLGESQGEEIRSLQSEVANCRKELTNLEALSTKCAKENAGLNKDVTTLTSVVEQRDKEFSILKNQIKSHEHTIQLYEEEFGGFVKRELIKRRGQHVGPLATLEPKQSNIEAENATRDTTAVPLKSRNHRFVGIQENSSSSFGSSADRKKDILGSGVKLTKKLIKGHEDFLAIAQRINYTKTLIPDSVKKDINASTSALVAMYDMQQKHLVEIIGGILHNLDERIHEEDTIAELIHSFPAALAFENDNGQTPMESILEIDENSMLDCNHSIKFIPLIVQGAMRHDIVEDDDLGGGLFKKYLRNNSLSDATSSPIARIVSSSNGAKTEDECVKFDEKCVEVLHKLRILNLLFLDDVALHQLLWKSCTVNSRKRFEYLVEWDPSALGYPDIFSENGQLLLHWIAQQNIDYFAIALAASMKCFPNDFGFIFSRDNFGQTPFEIAVGTYGISETMVYVQKYIPQNKYAGSQIMKKVNLRIPLYSKEFVDRHYQESSDDDSNIQEKKSTSPQKRKRTITFDDEVLEKDQRVLANAAVHDEFFEAKQENSSENSEDNSDDSDIDIDHASKEATASNFIRIPRRQSKIKGKLWQRWGKHK